MNAATGAWHMSKETLKARSGSERRHANLGI